MTESRPYWPPGRYLSARSQGVRRGQTWPWSALVDAEPGSEALVGPWQYQSAGWEGGIPGTTPSQAPTRTPPRVLPLPVPTAVAIAVDVGSALTCSLASTKEILGVDNALPGSGTRSTIARQRFPGPAVSLSPPVGPGAGCGRASAVSGISGISVYLSISRISQFKTDIPAFLSISQYFSVFQY